jgi:opacity protein-like surface antigen
MLRSLLLCGAALIAAAPVAAADLDGQFLRGAMTSTEDLPGWDGAYAGLSVGYGSAEAELANNSARDVETILRGTDIQNTLNASSYVTSLDEANQGMTYGFFFGHNWSMDGVVFGLEADYTRPGLVLDGRSNVSRFGTVGNIDGVGGNDLGGFDITYGTRIALHDLLLLKGRIGYDAGPLLPFATLGLAIARGDFRSSTEVATQYWYNPNRPPNTPDLSPTDEAVQRDNKGVFGLGFTGSVGVDYMISDGIFARAEYGITRIGEFENTMIDMQHAKVGIAAKF